jgi:predicted transcriptional regulator YdeE
MRMSHVLETLPALRLVGLRCFGRKEELPGRVAPAWRELIQRAPEIVGRLDPELYYGVTPEAQHLAPPPDGVYIYWACVRIAPNAPFPKGLGQLLIPAGRYLVAGPEAGITTVRDRWALERIVAGVVRERLRPIEG